MKNTSKILASLVLVIMAGCQKVQPLNDQPFTPDQPTGNDITLCSDGTLNCYVTLPPNVENITNLNFNQSYVSCMDGCLPATCTDSGGDIIDEASSECPAQFSACDSQCSITSGSSTLGGIPPSDGLTLPEHPKAVLVELTGCFDVGQKNEIHFQGPDIHFTSAAEGEHAVVSGGFFGLGSKKVFLGYGVGRNPNCPDNLKNKVIVKYTPVGESTVTLGSQTISVVPFTTASAITKNRPLPHSMSFGIPAAIRDEVDLSEITWFVKSFDQPEPTPFAHAVNDWRYFNSDIPYGQTVVFANYYVVLPFLGATVVEGAVIQKISAYVFIKSKD